MLKSLRVRDLALIASAEVGFGPGLNLLTGETGSGKSLVVDALTLSLGARASTDQVRHGSDRALVESVFEISDVPEALALLEEMGFEAEPELVLSREIGGRGASRLNGRPATPGQLRQLGRLLVDVHGQHEHQSLLDPEAQTRLLDAFAGAGDALAATAAAHGAWREAAETLAELERMKERGAREREFLEWRLKELEAAGLRAGEDEELAAERSVSRHAVRLTQLSQGAREDLSGDEAPARAAGSVRSAAELDPRLAGLAERLEAAGEEIREVAEELRRYGEGIDADPARLEQVESRLAALEEIKKRFGGSLEEAIGERDRLRLEVGAGEDLEGALAGAAREVAVRHATLAALSGELTLLRRHGAERMGREVSAELAGLRLAGGRRRRSARGCHLG